MTAVSMDMTECGQFGMSGEFKIVALGPELASLRFVTPVD